MFHPEDGKLEKYLAVAISLMACMLFISTAAMHIAGGFAALLGLVAWHKNKDCIALSDEIKGYMKAYGVFLLCLLPSVVFSRYPATGIKTFLDAWIWRYVIFVLIVVFIQRRDYLVNMLTAFLTVFSVDCFFTLVEVTANLRQSSRGRGFEGGVLTIASIMCMVLPIVLVILMDARFEKKLKQVATFSVIGTLVGLLCNKSRGAWLTELIVVPVATFRYLKQNKKRLLVVLAVFAGILGFMLTTPHYVKRIQSITNITTDRSNADRIRVWRSAEKMVRKYPVTGTGLGQFSKYYPKYRSKREKQNLGHTHNNFIHIAVESGVIGLAGLLYFLVLFLYTSFRNYRKDKNPYDILFFTICLGYICLFGQIDYTLGNTSAMRAMWFLLAVLLKLKATERPSGEIQQ